MHIFPTLALPHLPTTVFRFLAFSAFRTGLNPKDLVDPQCSENCSSTFQTTTLWAATFLYSLLTTYSCLRCLFGSVSFLLAIGVIAISIGTFNSFCRSEHFYHMHTYEKHLVFLYLLCSCWSLLSTSFICLLIFLFL